MGTLAEDLPVAAEWISRALTASGYRADFSPPSFWEIDRFYDEHTLDGRARPGGLLAENKGQRVFAIGAYIGEVIRRSLGGTWVTDDQDPQGELNIELQLVGGSIIWPVQRAAKRFHDSTDGIAAYGLALGVEVGPRPGAH